MLYDFEVYSFKISQKPLARIGVKVAATTGRDKGMSSTTQTDSTADRSTDSYGADSDLVDFILGITFEIWEQGQVEKIHDYYAADCEVYSLEGMTEDAATMVSNTHATLASFPDRLLIADDVITTGTAKKGFSSHRLISPMTNMGDTVFGPDSGQKVMAMNIADCEVNDGLITREWLVRDNLAVVTQLGFNPLDCARTIAARFDTRQIEWLASEYTRTCNDSGESGQDPTHSFARDVLEACWLTGDTEVLESTYAPYCVMHRAPLRRFSGRDQVLEHYTQWRSAFPAASLSVDHVCSQPFDQDNQRIAVRWSVAGLHEGDFTNAPASGKPVYILGVTHWQLVNGRIANEKTVIDELSVLAQTLD